MIIAEGKVYKSREISMSRYSKKQGSRVVGRGGQK
jgi:hypothetical protein